MSVMKWLVGALYAVHEYCKGHNGDMISLGKVAVSSFSTKQKINVKSSKESELVGVDDNMANILWSRYFIEAQKYNILHNRLMQDNKSAIPLEEGKFSNSKRTKHIHNR